MLLLVICLALVVLAVLFLSWWAGKKSTIGTSTSKPLSWQHGRRWARKVAYILLVAVALIPLALLGNRLLLVPTHTSSYHAHSAVPNTQLKTAAPCPTSTQAVLTLTLHGTDVTQDTVEADAALCIGDQELRFLWLPNRDAQEAKFTVAYGGSLPEISWARQVSVNEIRNHIDQLTGQRTAVDIGTLMLPLLGDASDYPLDTYSTVGNWYVKVPGGTDILGQAVYFNPLKIVVKPEAPDLRWRWDNVQSVGIVLEASRSFSSQLFIFVVVLLPFLLFLGLLLILMPRDVSEDRSAGRLPGELLVGVGAFLLAVLPVRAVLVSADITRLTVVDYALGTEMAVIVAATLILALARTTTYGRTKPPVPLDESSMSEAPCGTDTAKPLAQNDKPTGRDSALDSRDGHATGLGCSISTTLADN